MLRLLVVCCFGFYTVELPSSGAVQQADEIAQLLDRAKTDNSKETYQLLANARRLLEGNTDLTVTERRDLTSRFASVLFSKNPTVEDVTRVLAPAERKQIVRQAFYNGYLEHWLLDSPLPLWVTLDYRRGRDPKVRSIQVRLAEN